MIAFGDDNVVRISGPLLEWVTQEGITRELAKIGIIYTDEQKGTGVHGLRSLDEVTFLKRGFRWEPMAGVYVGSLEEEVIFEMLNWENSNPVPGSFKQTCRKSVHEAAGRGREFFKQYMDIVKGPMMEHDLLPAESTFRRAFAAFQSTKEEYC